MAETIFRGLFDTETAHVISVADFMYCYRMDYSHFLYVQKCLF